MKSFFISLWKKLRGNSFWCSVAALSTGQLAGQLIALVTTPIISRIYTQESMGYSAIIMSTATIIIGLIGLGIGSAIMAPTTDEEGALVLRVSFTVQVLLASVVFIVLLLISKWYKAFETDMPYWEGLLFGYLYILTSVLCSLMSVYVNRLKMNDVLLINPLISSLCTLCITIPLGLIGLCTQGLLLASIISTSIASIHMIKNANPFIERIKLEDIEFVFKKYRKYIIYQYPSNCVSTFSNQIPNQSISFNYGNAALGSYSMCNRIFGIPLRLVATPVQTVYFRAVSEKYRNGENLGNFTYSLLTKALFIGSVPVILAMCFGEQLFSFVLGSEWSEAGTLAAILALYCAFNFCENCVTYFRVAVGKQKINMVTSVLSLVLLLVPFLIGTLYQWSFIKTMICFSCVNTLLKISDCAINFWIMKKNFFKWLAFSTIYCGVCLSLSLIVRVLIA